LVLLPLVELAPEMETTSTPSLVGDRPRRGQSQAAFHPPGDQGGSYLPIGRRSTTLINRFRRRRAMSSY
jgi:hypothetical protein